MRKLIVLFLFISCRQSASEEQQQLQARPDELRISNFAFDFNNNFKIYPDTSSVISGKIIGEGITIKYMHGWISRKEVGLTQTGAPINVTIKVDSLNNPFKNITPKNITPDTSDVSVELDTSTNVFRKIVYDRDSINGWIRVILSSRDNLVNTNSRFPGTFFGITLWAKRLNKKQQDELLKIFRTSRLKKKDF
jgi:hypothetical protein